MTNDADRLRPLVLGAAGQLGTAFVRRVPGSVGVTRSQLDLSTFHDAELAELIDRHAPSHVVNCAAYTAVDRAEEEEGLATEVNGRAVGRMARLCAERDVPFVTYSTDYVFDGRASEPYLESDPVDPVNAYGRSKLEGERRALEVDGTLVVRTSWVISGTHPNFVATMLRLAAAGRALTVVDDQKGCPSFVDDLVDGTLDLVRLGVDGIVHLTNSGATTWYRLARAAIQVAGFDTTISPCSTEEYPTPAPRPRYSVLGSERLPGLGISLPNWQASLPGVVSRLVADPPAG